ncbi:MAG: alkaline phosphatase D family protein [Solirubrobacterales bacterium]
MPAGRRPELVLGPLLRYVSGTEATIWVETSAPCEVEILGATEPTFRVAEHHYALVRLAGLEPGSVREYEVALDGRRVWPALDGMPASRIRTLGGGGPLEIAFGSCRVAVPHEPPFTESADREDGFEPDALWVLASQMAGDERCRWPDQLFLLGDQVYVDEGSPRTRARIRRRRGTGTQPGEEILDFEEYTWLYQESWGEPLVSWLLSTVSTSMLWDDHDLSDDWNISYSWLQEVRQRSWWHRRAVDCIVSYWIYQHLGNLAPATLDASEIYREVRGNQHATGVLREWADSIDAEASGTRWSFCRDFGRTRALFVDSRAGRVLEADRRRIVDEGEWQWIVDHSEGDFDHLLVATTVPFMLSPGFDRLEAWNERLGEGAWGRLLARPSELLRRTVDFDHWAAFQESFAELRDLLAEIARGEHGSRPGSVVVLSGDVHHAYLCELGLPGGGAERAPIYQAVCSPYRNPLEEKERRVVRAGFHPAFSALTGGLARLAGAPPRGCAWRLLEGPHFDNQVATLRLDGREASLRLERSVPGCEEKGGLLTSFERRLA